MDPVRAGQSCARTDGARHRRDLARPGPPVRLWRTGGPAVYPVADGSSELTPAHVPPGEIVVVSAGPGTTLTTTCWLSVG